MQKCRSWSSGRHSFPWFRISTGNAYTIDTGNSLPHSESLGTGNSLPHSESLKAGKFIRYAGVRLRRVCQWDIRPVDMQRPRTGMAPFEHQPCHFCIFLFLCPALTEHTVFVVSVRNGSQLSGVPWDLRLAGHTSATHTFLVFFIPQSLSSQV